MGSRVKKTMGVVLAVTVAGLIPMGLANAAEGEAAIKGRIDFMDVEVYGQFKVLAAYAKDGKGSLADVEKSAKALVNLAKKMPTHFPKDSGRGHFPDTMTRALPGIWTDWARFEKEVQRLAEGSERLARLASAGDRDGVVELIGPAGSYARTKIGCAECHDAFRGARAKK